MSLKKKYDKMLSFFLLIFSLIFFSNKTVNADEVIGFSVSPIFPESQIDKDLGYFYLNTEPDTTQEVKVKIKSLREDPTTISIHVNDAITNDNVSVEYSNDNPDLDNSLENPISELLQVNESEQEVTVSNFEEKIVTLTLNVPKDPFSGIKLGGIRFIEQSEDSESEGLSNRYGYTVGVMINQDNEPFNEGADLKLKDVGATLNRGMKVVYAELQNPEPKLLGGLTIDANVYKLGDSEPLLTETRQQLSVAPNSNFSYFIPWGIKDLNAGEYEIVLVANSGEQNWEWRETFTVGPKQASNINRQSLNRLSLSTSLKFLIVFLILVLFTLIIYHMKDMINN